MLFHFLDSFAAEGQSLIIELLRATSPKARKALVDSLIASFGLTRSENVLVGTPLRKGLSGGQKRRVSVAAQLVTGPQILFLDEPTSGEYFSLRDARSSRSTDNHPFYRS